MSKVYATAMVAGDLAPAAGTGHASYQDGWPVVAVPGATGSRVVSMGQRNTRLEPAHRIENNS